jgi:hypothetical protein
MKKWYASRTLWVNILLAVAVVVNSQWGFQLSPEEQGGIIIVINLILRAITKEGLTL